MQNTFSERLLKWFDQHGRKDLPWQQPRTAYRVWVSEIMLQQTQVATVIPYFERFMQRFDSLASLAAAEQDEVMHYWSGLGYYARARNLHKAAQQLIESGAEDLPADREQLEALPGIGRSTAAAIVAQVWNQPEAILDGNVKRVLARHRKVEGWTGSSAVQKKLWQLAEAYTPSERVADYTQAIMDLGATLCSRSKPDCALCPLAEDCIALEQHCVDQLPTPKKRKAIPQKERFFLVIQNSDNEVLLQKRPPSGIWGGLWSLPEVNEQKEIAAACQKLGFEPGKIRMLDSVKHVFSHFQLKILPVHIQAENDSATIGEQPELTWYSKNQPDALGLPAPVSAIIEGLL